MSYFTSSVPFTALNDKSGLLPDQRTAMATITPSAQSTSGVSYGAEKAVNFSPVLQPPTDRGVNVWQYLLYVLLMLLSLTSTVFFIVSTAEAAIFSQQMPFNNTLSKGYMGYFTWCFQQWAPSYMPTPPLQCEQYTDRVSSSNEPTYLSTSKAFAVMSCIFAAALFLQLALLPCVRKLRTTRSLRVACALALISIMCTTIALTVFIVVKPKSYPNLRLESGSILAFIGAGFQLVCAIITGRLASKKVGIFKNDDNLPL